MLTTFDITLFQLTLMLAVCFWAGLVKGGFGFGLPLITVAVLPLFVDLDLVLAVNAVMLVVSNVFQFLGEGAARTALNRFWPVLVGITIGAPIGAALLSLSDGDILNALVGGVIMFFVLMNWINPRFHIPKDRERLYGGLNGIFSGGVGAMTTAIGPLFALFILGVDLERKVYRAALGLFFLYSGLLFSISYTAVGLMTPERVALALLCTVPGVIGMRVGAILADKVPQNLFRQALFLLLFGLGLYMVYRSLF